MQQYSLFNNLTKQIALIDSTKCDESVVIYSQIYKDGKTEEEFNDVIKKFENIGIKCQQKHDSMCGNRLECDSCTVHLKCFIKK